MNKPIEPPSVHDVLIFPLLILKAKVLSFFSTLSTKMILQKTDRKYAPLRI